MNICRYGAVAIFSVLVGSATAFAQLPQIVPGRAAVQKPNNLNSHESWEVIYLGDNRIGYSHARTRQAEVDGKRVIATTSDLHLTFKRLGDTTVIKTHQELNETPAGELLSFEFEMRNPPKSISRTSGKVEDRFLRLETQNGDRKDKRSRNWVAKTQSPVYQDRSIRQTPLTPGETRTFNVFMPDLDSNSTVKFAADEHRFVKLLDGKQHKLLLVRVSQSVNPTLTTRAYYADNGELMLTETNLLGQTMSTYRVSQAEALKEIAGEELDLIVNTMVPVGPIEIPHRGSKIVYRISMDDDDPSRFLSKGITQAIKKLDDNTVELTVTRASVPEKSSNAPVDVDANSLKSTRLLQSDDYRVKELARNGAAGETDPEKVAFRLERYVSTKLKTKNFSTALASAAEVAASLEGDCTEHAMLLAAMSAPGEFPREWPWAWCMWNPCKVSAGTCGPRPF